MSILPFILVMSASAHPPTDQPASTSMYSRPDFAAKSTKRFMLSVVKAVLPFASTEPLHQSQAALAGVNPGGVLDFGFGVEAGDDVGFDEVSPGSLAMRMTRQAVWWGSGPTMRGSFLFWDGAMRDSSMWPCQEPAGLVRYMAAFVFEIGFGDGEPGPLPGTSIRGGGSR